MICRLHQGGAEGELDRLAIFQRQVPDGLGCVGLFRDRDRQSGLAQLGHETDQDVEHENKPLRLRGSKPGGDRELLSRDLDVRLVLEKDVQGRQRRLRVD